MADLRIGVIGAGGRMGGAILRQAQETPGVAVVAACENAGHPAVGRDAGEVAGIGANRVIIGTHAQPVFDACDAAIEFSTPDASVAHAKLAAARKKIHVIGTTGLDAGAERALGEAAKTATIKVLFRGYAKGSSRQKPLIIFVLPQMTS